eukprot:comp20024_c0_seq1/m.24573 comp20024_c0_seq1/g.24573  ORF comp20024_c0_seq1/g.24573 comp20024_c0_seq1/m.24573 type:complete len:554 (-) comp20024_c0_seq1:475-2136(-)
MKAAVVFAAFAAHANAQRSGGSGDPIRVAYGGDKQDMNAFAEALKAVTGLHYVANKFDTTRQAMEDVAAGTSDLTFVNANAAIYGQDKQTIPIAIETTASSGKPYVDSQMWVRKDSNIRTFPQTQGLRSCHPSSDDEEGVYLPISYAVHNGYMLPVGNSMAATISGYFTGGSCAPPKFCAACKMPGLVPGQCPSPEQYEEYGGPIRDLLDGNCDVAFVSDVAISKSCNGTAPPDWCQKLPQLKMLQSMGQVPNDIWIAKENALNPTALKNFKDGMLGSKSHPQGQTLYSMLNHKITGGFEAAKDYDSYLGDFSEAIACMPELQDLLGVTNLDSCMIAMKPPEIEDTAGLSKAELPPAGISETGAPVHLKPPQPDQVTLAPLPTEPLPNAPVPTSAVVSSGAVASAGVVQSGVASVGVVEPGVVSQAPVVSNAPEAPAPTQVQPTPAGAAGEAATGEDKYQKAYDLALAALIIAIIGCCVCPVIAMCYMRRRTSYWQQHNRPLRLKGDDLTGIGGTSGDIFQDEPTGKPFLREPEGAVSMNQKLQTMQKCMQTV